MKIANLLNTKVLAASLLFVGGLVAGYQGRSKMQDIQQEQIERETDRMYVSPNIQVDDVMDSRMGDAWKAYAAPFFDTNNDKVFDKNEAKIFNATRVAENEDNKDELIFTTKMQDRTESVTVVNKKDVLNNKYNMKPDGVVDTQKELQAVFANNVYGRLAGAYPVVLSVSKIKETNRQLIADYVTKGVVFNQTMYKYYSGDKRFSDSTEIRTSKSAGDKLIKKIEYYREGDFREQSEYVDPTIENQGLYEETTRYFQNGNIAGQIKKFKPEMNNEGLVSVETFNEVSNPGPREIREYDPKINKEGLKTVSIYDGKDPKSPEIRKEYGNK